MKALEFLNKVLYEGWDNTQVLTHTDSSAETASEFATDAVGECFTTLRDNYEFNPEATYGIVYVRKDDLFLDDDFYGRADFIAELEIEYAYFYELD